jgi:hypothetical protein
MRRALLLAVLMLALAAGSAMAWVNAVGEPVESNSWFQRFEESGVGDYNYMQVAMFTEGDFFEAPVFSNFSAYGWTWGPVQLDGTPMKVAWAYGPALVWMQFDIKFAGDTSNKFGFTFQQSYELLPGGGWKLRDTADARWTGSEWVINPGDNSAKLTMPLIPEASTVMLALMGLGAVAGFRRLRRG